MDRWVDKLPSCSFAGRRILEYSSAVGDDKMTLVVRWGNVIACVDTGGEVR